MKDVLTAEALRIAEEHVAYCLAQGQSYQEMLSDAGLRAFWAPSWHESAVWPIAFHWQEEIAPAVRGLAEASRIRRASRQKRHGLKIINNRLWRKVA